MAKTNKDFTTKTTQADLDAVFALAKVVSTLLATLYCRWMDEKEYEDFAEYQTRMKKEIPAGYEFVRMTKRPFGVECKIPSGQVFAIRCNLTKLTYERIS